MDLWVCSNASAILSGPDLIANLKHQVESKSSPSVFHSPWTRDRALLPGLCCSHGELCNDKRARARAIVKDILSVGSYHIP